ncbi:hypothetical protein [Microvirga sp. BSC39]|uniref:hypothetical protein n=1 Tax=Microvirga sp. BSC39 TaxID=1549810 RepID=UPI0004E91ECF|nr:hypothetical protein [Microvirga sp. BSC39]KFG68855.1 hypothetical protein JH26_14055 [Microvirga sp. BSC39]
MPGIARQFESQITRTGGAPSKYRFTARCSTCSKTDIYEASRPANDDLVKGYFKERGWLLGRDRAYDLCAACLSKPREERQSRPSNDAGPQRSPAAASPSGRPSAPADKRPRDTADILARHLGKPEALAAEVFRPKPVQFPRPSTPETPAQTGSTPTLPREVEQALTGMAAELKSLRSTIEGMAEQIGKLVALGGQQIEAIARLAPLMVQSADGIVGGLREVVSAIQPIPSESPPEPEPLKAEEPLTREAEPVERQDPELSSDPEPRKASQAKERSRAGLRPAKTEAQVRHTGSAAIVVKSIPDAKRSDRFYTSIRLPRDLWDQAGFGPDDRLLLDWSGKTLTIERVAEGGVKPKAVGSTSVVLQSWKLGNLNFAQSKIAGADGSLRLTAGRRSPKT